MMAGPNDGRTINYTTITFDGTNTSHPPPARRGTKYSNVLHDPVPEGKEAVGGGAGARAEASRDDSVMPPSYVGMQNVQPLPPDVSKDNPTYDTPPPPIPLRLESQDSINMPGGSGGSGSRSNEVKSAETTTTSTAMFGDDPFSDSNANAWGDSDPSAFYDRPPSEAKLVSVVSKKTEVEDEEDGYFEISKVSTNPSAVNTADFTGDSTYEDTCSFLQDIRSRYKNMDPEEVLGSAAHGGRNKANVQATPSVGGEDDEEMPYDLPPREVLEEGGDRSAAERKSNEEDDDESHGGSYDFPSELNRYPFKEAAKNEPSGGSAPTGKMEKLDQNAPRHNMPLPPLPDEPGVGGGPVPREGVPPLPDRQVSNAAVRLGSGPASKGRDQPLPPVPQSVDRPPLPPMNHPWGNKRSTINPSSSAQLSASFSGDFPPLPPRKKNPNGHSAAEPPPPPYHQAVTAQEPQEDPALLDLLNSGYQRADIERALRIARNDYDMAKSILQEFGGRH